MADLRSESCPGTSARKPTVRSWSACSANGMAELDKVVERDPKSAKTIPSNRHGHRCQVYTRRRGGRRLLHGQVSHAAARPSFSTPGVSFPSCRSTCWRVCRPRSCGSTPTGTLPSRQRSFRLHTAPAGANWTFQANPAFPAGLGGRPFLDRHLSNHRTDHDSHRSLTENIDVYLAPTPQVQILDSDDLDLRGYRQINFVTWHARRPQLSERVRQAITKGTDRRQIVEALFYARVPNRPYPLLTGRTTPRSGPRMAYDPEAASALLAEAGCRPGRGRGAGECAGSPPLDRAHIQSERPSAAGRGDHATALRDRNRGSAEFWRILLFSTASSTPKRGTSTG